MKRVLGPRGIAGLGVLAGAANVLWLIARVSRDPSTSFGAFFVSVGFLAGTPLILPWLPVLFAEWKRPVRPLRVIERLVYGAVILAEICALGFLPRFLVESEGFGALYLWALALPVALILLILSSVGRSTGTRAGASGS